MNLPEEKPGEYKAMGEMLNVALQFNVTGTHEAELKILDALDSYLYVVKSKLDAKIKLMEPKK